MPTEELDPAAEPEQEQDDWVERIPCPDESCIGTLDRDGRCRICGRQGEAPPAGENQRDDEIKDAADPQPPDTALDREAEEKAGDDGEAPDPPSGDAWEERRLCPDESCIGTLGQDGNCRVCGRRESEPAPH